MVLLQLLNEPGTAELSVHRFPFSLGRAPGSDLRLTVAGVWDHHADLLLHQGREVVLTAQADASVLVNGQPVPQAVLRNGDVIDLGGARLRFTFAPPIPRSLKPRETLTWLALGALFVLQVALIYWILD